MVTTDDWRLTSDVLLRARVTERDSAEDGAGAAAEDEEDEACDDGDLEPAQPIC